MKKITTIFIILLCLSSISIAQTNFGLKGGLNFASLGGTDAKDVESKTGFLAGGFLTYNFSNAFGLQIEALYSQKGGIQKILVNNVTVTATWNVDYLEVPALLKVSIPLASGGSLKPYLMGGGSLGINLSSKIKAEAQGQSSETDVKNDTKSTDFGLAVGGGLDFLLGRGNFNVDVRYTFGLSTIDNTADPADIKNSGISLTIGYAIN